MYLEPCFSTNHRELWHCLHGKCLHSCWLLISCMLKKKNGIHKPILQWCSLTLVSNFLGSVSVTSEWWDQLQTAPPAGPTRNLQWIDALWRLQRFMSGSEEILGGSISDYHGCVKSEWKNIHKKTEDVFGWCLFKLKNLKKEIVSLPQTKIAPEKLPSQ